jgi:hypothetical protein
MVSKHHPRSSSLPGWPSCQCIGPTTRSRTSLQAPKSSAFHTLFIFNCTPDHFLPSLFFSLFSVNMKPVMFSRLIQAVRLLEILQSVRTRLNNRKVHRRSNGRNSLCLPRQTGYRVIIITANIFGTAWLPHFCPFACLGLLPTYLVVNCQTTCISSCPWAIWLRGH